MDGGAQTACLLWLVPRYPWGEVICILVKIGSSYLSDRRFCPDIDLCSVFNFPIIKDTLADKVLDIDYKRRKGNVRESSMRIGVSSTEELKNYAKMMNVSRNLRPPSLYLSKVDISRLDYE